MTSAEDPTLSTLRRHLLLVLSFAMIGTAADLLLLGHHEGGWQWAPLLLIAVALPLALRLGIRSQNVGPNTVLAFRAAMAAFVVAGILGVVLHFQGNGEFQRELDPGLEGWPLVVKVMTAKAPPALAPAVMAYMGLVGLLCSHRHPAMTDSRPTARERAGARQ